MKTTDVPPNPPNPSDSPTTAESGPGAPGALAAFVASFRGYRALPALAGRSYLPITVIGRLPVTMVPLGVLTLTTAATGSIAVAGVAAAGTAVGEAVGAPTAGQLADRLGQRPVLLVGVALHVLFLLGLLLACGVLGGDVDGGASDPLVVLAAAAVGLTVPQVGPLSRARWMAMTSERSGDRRHLTTAMAFESTVDEFAFVMGPALVGLAALVGGPAAPVVTTAVLIGGAVTLFAVHPTHRRVVPGRVRPAPAPVPATAGGTAVGAGPDRAGPAAPAPRQAPVATGRRVGPVVPLAGMFALGAIFGSAQVGLTAVGTEAGEIALGPLLAAALGVGSAITALCMVAVPARIGHWTRWAVTATGLTLGLVLVVLAPGLGWLWAAVVLAGCFIGPTLVTVSSVAGERAAPGRGGLVMSLLTSGTVLGLAAGSAVAGQLAEAVSPQAAVAVGVVAGAALVVLPVVAGRLER